VRTVEFTLLPHPLDALKPMLGTFTADIAITLDADATLEYAR